MTLSLNSWLTLFKSVSSTQSFGGTWRPQPRIAESNPHETQRTFKARVRKKFVSRAKRVSVKLLKTSRAGWEKINNNERSTRTPHRSDNVSLYVKQDHPWSRVLTKYSQTKQELQWTSAALWICGLDCKLCVLLIYNSDIYNPFTFKLIMSFSEHIVLPKTYGSCVFEHFAG